METTSESFYEVLVHLQSEIGHQNSRERERGELYKGLATWFLSIPSGRRSIISVSILIWLHFTVGPSMVSNGRRLCGCKVKVKSLWFQKGCTEVAELLAQSHELQSPWS